MGEFYHFGVKGMHWGVRKKDDAQGKQDKGDIVGDFIDNKKKISKQKAATRTSTGILLDTGFGVVGNALAVGVGGLAVSMLPMPASGRIAARGALSLYGTYKAYDILSTGAMSMYYKHKG